MVSVVINKVIAQGDARGHRASAFGDFSTGTVTQRATNLFEVIYANGSRETFIGTGLTYDAQGLPDSGTFTQYAWQSSAGGSVTYFITTFDARAVVAASRTLSPADDRLLFAEEMKGNEVLIAEQGTFGATLEGMAGNDIYSMSGFATVLDLEGGNDRLVGTPGRLDSQGQVTERRDLGPGIDAVHLPYNLIQIGVERLTTISSRVNAEGNIERIGNYPGPFLPHYLGENIEVVTSTNATLSFDPSGVAAHLLRLYQAVLDRQPDRDGITFWTKEVTRTKDIVAGAQGILDSAEARSKGGADLLTRVYDNLLNRAVDEGGREYWMGRRAEGMSEAHMVAAISDSVEAHQLYDENVQLTGVMLAANPPFV